MMNKEECSEVLTRLLRPYFASVEIQNAYHSINKGHSIDYDSNVLTLLIEEHFNPQPYEYEDLKPGMWLWDKEIGACMYVKEIKGKEIVLLGGESFIVEIVNINDEFEEGRFFPVTKALEYQR